MEVIVVVWVSRSCTCIFVGFQSGTSLGIRQSALQPPAHRDGFAVLQTAQIISSTFINSISYMVIRSRTSIKSSSLFAFSPHPGDGLLELAFLTGHLNTELWDLKISESPRGAAAWPARIVASGTDLYQFGVRPSQSRSHPKPKGPKRNNLGISAGVVHSTLFNLGFQLP